MPISNPNGLAVRPIESRQAAQVVIEHHYLHRKPPISYAFGIFHGDQLKGVCTFGTPPSRHLQMSACPTDPGLVIELNRLWVSDEMPRNTESWFISRCLTQLPPRIVVSYADTREQHYGYVYRAANFHYAGWTDMDRKTPRYDYIPADPAVHSRDAFRNGYARKVRRLPKVRYWTTTGSRTDKKVLTAKSGWGRLDWKTLPPPEMKVAK